MAKGYITREQLDAALLIQQTSLELIGVILMKNHWVTEENLVRALAEQFEIPFLTLKETYIDWELSDRYGSMVCSEKKFFPFRRSENDAIDVAISNPLDVMALARFEERVKPLRIKVVLVVSSELDACLSKCASRLKGSLKRHLDEEGT